VQRLRIIVGGFLGLLPAGGVTWDYVQYPAGLAALGHDVHYVEDTQLWPVYQAGDGDGADCTPNVEHLSAVMEAFGLADRWAYRDAATGRLFGRSEAALRELCRTADVFLNLSCSTPLREAYADIPVRALVDTDPMFTQIQFMTQAAFTPGAGGMRGLVASHTHHFTFGENIGAADCRIPDCGVSWRPTRQPVCLDGWEATPPPDDPYVAFTTLMNWTAGVPLEYDGEAWRQKDVEFLRIRDLPGDVPRIPLAVAVAQTTGAPFPADAARRAGWRVLDPAECTPDWRSYRRFIDRSRGEFSVAKETYVKARTGWFSCRSACYLAAGRPVITQETGWTKGLPSGRGLLAFDDRESAAAALTAVAADPIGHARAARAIAEEFFDSDRVLGDLLDQLSA
jgi:hypothetical protein